MSGIFIDSVDIDRLTTGYRGGVHDLSENTPELINVSLSWMQNEALLAGLAFKESNSEWDRRDVGTRPHQISLSGLWWILEVLPVLRPSRRDPSKTTR